MSEFGNTGCGGSHQSGFTLQKENEELRVIQLQKDERIQSLVKTIEDLKQEKSQTNPIQDDEYQLKDNTREEKFKLQESSSLDEDQSSNIELLAKVASLEIQLKKQRNLLNSKNTQINAQAETIRKHEYKLQENQDVIQGKHEKIIALERKNTHLESVLLRMETVVEKSNRLQKEYCDEMTKLQAQTQEQAALLDEKEEQINDQSLKMKYLSDLCCQAQEAMHEDKATIVDLKIEIGDFEKKVEQQKEDLNKCNQSLSIANQMITLTEQRDSFLKSYVQRLASYYQNKEEQRGSCFSLKMFGGRRQQSLASSIVNKLAQVLLGEEQN